MNVIRKRTFIEFWARHPESRSSLEPFYRVCRHADWNDFAELRQTFPSADQVPVKVDSRAHTMTVFNVGGNNYRVIAEIVYRRKRMYVTHVLTHKDYDTNRWKRQV